MSEATADALDAAADWIEEFGWVQGALWRRPNGMGALNTPIPDGVPVCSIGAIVAVCSRQGRGRAASQSLVQAAFVLVIGSHDIGSWNDYMERDKQQVLDAFRQAAKLERL